MGGLISTSVRGSACEGHRGGAAGHQPWPTLAYRVLMSASNSPSTGMRPRIAGSVSLARLCGAAAAYPGNCRVRRHRTEEAYIPQNADSGPFAADVRRC